MSDVDVDEILKKLDIDDGTNIDWDDEKDGKDPELLAELKELLGKEPVVPELQLSDSIDISGENLNLEGQIVDEEENTISEGVDFKIETSTQEQTIRLETSSETRITESADSNYLPIEEKLKCTDKQILEKYIRLEQVKAVQFKQAECLKNSKLLKSRLIEIQSNMAESLPAPQQRKSSSDEKNNVAETKLKSSQPSTSPVFDQIKDILKSQISFCKENTNPKFGELILLFQKDLTRILGLERNGLSLPPFLYKDVDVTYEQCYTDMPLNELKLEIRSVSGLYFKDNGSVIPACPYFNVEFPYPESQKASSPVFKQSSSFEPNYSKTFVIDRSKAFKRFTERKKLTVEFFHYRGFFRKSVSIGKVVIPLNTLNKKALIHEAFQLIGADRKPTGAIIDIIIKIREPLDGNVAINETKRFLFLQENDPINLPNFALNSKPEIIRQKSGKEDKKKQVNASWDIEMDEQLFDIGRFESNLLMEKEIERIDALIINNRGTAPECLEDRKQQLQIKINMLVLQVQTGSLTLDEYMKRVNRQIEIEKRCALEYKKANKIQHATMCMWRIKIMKGEIDEVVSQQ
ncbi:hypothetical protein O9G_001588 [Rozella allomycis CSF55]|uniref:C2 domain-containing protein n=1 Tax=Rozella allomycis (strain CSF55) TaxID=988480 RepID=A0A075AWZ9_ROZAC|nr:hypothetical protein O9G_001588 [Rozella allomycis CSF55]|eukprot:EPZ33237.1 hypothetical protein O9G_001588 [Rozella allomycis CSF55]